MTLKDQLVISETSASLIWTLFNFYNLSDAHPAPVPPEAEGTMNPINFVNKKSHPFFKRMALEKPALLKFHYWFTSLKFFAPKSPKGDFSFRQSNEYLLFECTIDSVFNSKSI